MGNTDYVWITRKTAVNKANIIPASTNLRF